MKRPVLAALSAVLLFGGPAFAQQPYQKSGDEKKVSTADPGQMKTSEGTVKEFEAGKKLVLTSTDKKTLTFKLDQKGVTLNIDPSVAIGSHVKVTEQKVGDMKSLTIEPVSRPLAALATHPGAKS